MLNQEDRIKVAKKIPPAPVDPKNAPLLEEGTVTGEEFEPPDCRPKKLP